jgi:hypothetical protein
MIRSFTQRLTAVALLVVASSVAFACSESAADRTVELTLSDLPPSAGVTTAGDWQSVGFLGDPWQRYAARTRLVMEHGLGREPSSVLVYLSFDASGGAATLSAGDTARIISVDDRFVTIDNHTEADFYVRVVLR